VVDDAAAVVHRHIALDLDLAAVRVDLDLRHVRAAGK
jgi:hypothetical protein